MQADGEGSSGMYRKLLRYFTRSERYYSFSRFVEKFPVCHPGTNRIYPISDEWQSQNRVKRWFHFHLKKLTLKTDETASVLNYIETNKVKKRRIFN